MANIKIILDHGGMEALLKSPLVEGTVLRKAEAVAIAANTTQPQHESGPVKYHFGSETGRSRAVAWVVAEHVMGPYLEQKWHTLRRAVMGLR